MNVRTELRPDGSIKTSWEDIPDQKDGSIISQTGNPESDRAFAWAIAAEKIRLYLKRRPLLFSDFI
jgi:hypothetical protein